MSTTFFNTPDGLKTNSLHYNARSNVETRETRFGHGWGAFTCPADAVTIVHDCDDCGSHVSTGIRDSITFRCHPCQAL